jgi:hypothetical protein
LLTIIIIEVVLLLNVWQQVNVFLPFYDKEGDSDNQKAFNDHMRRTIIFLLQDVAFGYFWLIYREPRDVFSVYSEFSKFN